jgi:hypothetical protein
MRTDGPRSPSGGDRSGCGACRPSSSIRNRCRVGANTPEQTAGLLRRTRIAGVAVRAHRQEWTLQHPLASSRESCPSRLSQRDLARLLADGGRPAGASPLPAVAPELQAVEVDRVVKVAAGSASAAGRSASACRWPGNASACAWTASCCTSRRTEPATPHPALPAATQRLRPHPRRPTRHHRPSRRTENPSRRRKRPQTRDRRPGRTQGHHLRQRHPDQSRPPPQHHQPEPHQGEITSSR